MICLSIANVSFNEALELVKNNKLCELRLDKLNFSKDELKTVIKNSNELIVCCRNSNIEKLKIAIDEGVTYLDLDLENNEAVNKELIEYLRNKKTKLIVSYHNYEKTPLREELLHIVEWAKSKNPDIIKIACMSNSERDNARLLGLLDSELPMVVIGMGELGKITRVIAPKLGSLFTYVSVSETTKTAPGQFSKEELESFLKGLHYV